MSKEGGMEGMGMAGAAGHAGHAPHSERTGVTEVVEEGAKLRRRRAAVMPAQMLALCPHAEVGELLTQRRRIADDFGVGLREIIRERDDPPRPSGWIGRLT